ncbi:cytochrome o ubiquinol oxidase subunit IV [Roseomonas sp. KE2513]|uniref:cytochrome o ubiquinol oxidase subunit IV n=1 Tax=Roseomonas sp. KE2513 TaxID=2479202 RepID=UPI0018DFB284|nr:cytochrome o ubiquinol oxidase subunit IV [Roseomonas sp. KE2513]MBI0537761.1 cytochrome o ubiquinol oxidase subunit IV [Roseomonas sp. KE2513]
MSTTHPTEPHVPELHGHGDTHGHGTRRGYLTGFLLSVILTAIPFWLVMTETLSSTPATAVAIFGCAFVQIVVHVVYFLHLDTRSEGGWTLIAFIFTVVIVGITIGGSIWVMYHLNTNMMPMMPLAGSR